MRKNWQGLALKLMRWIEGRSLCSAILCFIDSILSDVSFQHLHCFIDSILSDVSFQHLHCFIDSILSDVSFQHLHCFIDSQMSVFNISIDVNVSNFKFTQHSEVSCDSVSSWCKLPPVALVQGTSSSMHSCQGKSPKCATWLRCADAHSQPSARCIARINLACSGCLANINIVLFCVKSASSLNLNFWNDERNEFCNETTSCQPSHSVEFALIRLFKDVMEKKPETKAGCLSSTVNTISTPYQKDGEDNESTTECQQHCQAKPKTPPPPPEASFKSQGECCCCPAAAQASPPPAQETEGQWWGWGRMEGQVVGSCSLC